MKIKLSLIVATFLLTIPVFTHCSGAEAKTKYAATAANDVLEAACQQAAKESKLVFLKSGYPECGWCRIFDRYHKLPEVQKIIGKYYVVAVIDTENMPDGNAVFGKYAQPGAPSWVVLTPQKHVIVDSYAPTPDGNVGYPARPSESAYYLAALKKATPAITDEELGILAQELQKAMEK